MRHNGTSIYIRGGHATHSKHARTASPSRDTMGSTSVNIRRGHATHSKHARADSSSSDTMGHYKYQEKNGQ